MSSKITLPNMYVDIWRSDHASNGATLPAQPYLNHVEGHLTRIRDSQLMRLSASGLKGTYEFYTDISLDIRMGDIFKNFVVKANGRTWYEVTDTEMWRVTDVQNSSPGFLEYKDIVLDRIIAGGPAPLG